LPLKYEAQKILQRMMVDEDKSAGSARLVSANQLKQKQVEYKKSREDEQNMENMLRQQGESFPIRYGQCIQLQHIVSKNFLTLIPRTAADFDQECMKVGLTSGDDGSLFVVQPQYKVRSEGAQVLFTDHILLENQRLAGGTGFLHYSLNSESEKHEINLSEKSAQCRFRIQCYTNYQASSDAFMQIGGTVRILHPETDSYLDASANQHLEKHQVYLKPGSNGMPQVRSAFIVENIDKTKGGLLKWGGEFRLKHLVTGKYLSRGPVMTTDKDGKSVDEDPTTSRPRASSLPEALQTQQGPHLVHLKSWGGADSQMDLLFSAHSTEGHGVDETIEVGTTITLKNGELLLGSSTMKGSADADENEKQGESADDDGLGLSTAVILSLGAQVEETAVQLQPIPATELHDIVSGLQALTSPRSMRSRSMLFLTRFLPRAVLSFLTTCCARITSKARFQ
jgi:hypothetical protein